MKLALDAWRYTDFFRGVEEVVQHVRDAQCPATIKIRQWRQLESAS